MTHDEIMALDADGLRLAVAKRLGWTDIEPYEEFGLWGAPPEWENTHTWSERLPNWPEDIAAALGLIGNTRCTLWHETEWHCAIYYEEWAGKWREKANGETAPIAICRAYLLWKEAQP